MAFWGYCFPLVSVLRCNLKHVSYLIVFRLHAIVYVHRQNHVHCTVQWLTFYSRDIINISWLGKIRNKHLKGRTVWLEVEASGFQSLHSGHLNWVYLFIPILSPQPVFMIMGDFKVIRASCIFCFPTSFSDLKLCISKFTRVSWVKEKVVFLFWMQVDWVFAFLL